MRTRAALLAILITAVVAAPAVAQDVLEFRTLKDAGRHDRHVPIKVVYPEGQGPFPMVVYTHGGMGTWDAHLYEAQHMARNGYVVLMIEHVYSNAARSKEYIRAAKGTLKERVDVALLKITQDPKAVLERPRDVSYAIDWATRMNRTHDKLQGKFDLAKIAVAGHSFGAYTTLAVCGARPILDHLKPRVEPGQGLARSAADPRVTIGIAMSPQGSGTSRFSKESFKTIDRPMLCFSGSKDDQFGHDGTRQPATRRLECFRLMPEGSKLMLWLENADHFSFAFNPKSKLFPSPARSDARKIVEAFTLAFCDLHLKGKEDAKAKLTKKAADALCGKVVTKITWYEK